MQKSLTNLELNEDNYILRCDIIDPCVEAIVVDIVDFDDFLLYLSAYQLLVIDGEYTLVRNDSKTKDIDDERYLDELRERREVECFPIINRGELWYARLSEDQVLELNTWYDDWLNVTETLTPPKKPEWL